jgi:NAD(P)-dependent dehydrogenase (short-subunit alcohol dehydrogenase family)
MRNKGRLHLFTHHATAQKKIVPNKVLVTGASGLLGVAAIEKFFSAGWATVSVSRPLVATVTPGCQQTANKTSDISPAALMIFKAVSRFSM